MSESTTPVEHQAPVTQRVQCPFCLFTNEIATDAADPLCLNCHLGLTRLVATADGRVAPVQRPEILEEPFEPRPVKGRKPKRSKRAKRHVTPYVATPDASAGDVARALGSPQVPPVTPPYGTPGATPVTPPAPVMTPPAGDVAIDERMEATVVHVASPRAQATWVLEFETGEVIPLPSDDIVVGRHPEPQGDATPVALPDPTRMLSRTHARLRRDASRDIWTITDLGSSNGVATVSSDTGAIDYATPGVDVPATEYLLIGTLRSRLHRVPATRHLDATCGVAS